MATDKLKIILDAVWQGKGAIQKAGKDIGGVTKASEASTKALKVMSGAALAGAAALGAISVWALKSGVDILATKGHFDRLTESIDSSADAMLGRMREATGGLVSDMDLIAGANEIMLGKLANTEDAVVRLSAVSGALNWDMGVLAQTINNQSVLRLDNLGLAVEDVIPRFKELQETMSDKAAFGLAVIEAGEKNVVLLGDASDTAAGKIQAIVTAGENAKTAFAESFATQLTEQLEDVSGEVKNTEASLVELAATGGAALASLIKPIMLIAIGFTDVQAEILEARIEIAKLNASLPTAGPLGDLFGEYQASGQAALPILAKQLGEVRSRSQALQGGLKTTTDEFMDLAAIVPAVTSSLDEAGAAAKFFGGNVTYVKDAQDRAHTSLISTLVALQAQEGALGGVGSAAIAAADSMQKMADATGNYFIQAQKSTEFDPLQATLEAAAGKGANAFKLSQFGQQAGLFDADEAKGFMNEALMQQMVDTLISDMLAAGDVGGALDLLSSIEGDLESGALLAEDFFQEVNNNDIKTDWDTSEAEASAQALLDWADNYSVSPTWIWDVQNTPGGTPPVSTPPPITTKQYGGPVSANTPYIVGEAGTELFVPSNNGTIIPNGGFGGAGGGGVTINNYTAASAAVAMMVVQQNRRGRLGL